MKRLEQLMVAEDQLAQQRASYKKAGIPIELSPKMLTFSIEGSSLRVVNAAQRIQEMGLRVTQEVPALIPLIEPRLQPLRIFIRSSHFDFEGPEAAVIGLRAQNIAHQEGVTLDNFGAIDLFEGRDTKGPLNIPEKWRSCFIAGIPTIGINRRTEGSMNKAALSISSSLEGTQINHLNEEGVDPRLTRVKLLRILRDLVEQTKGKRKDLVDIQFSC